MSTTPTPQALSALVAVVLGLLLTGCTATTSTTSTTSTTTAPSTPTQAATFAPSTPAASTPAASTPAASTPATAPTCTPGASLVELTEGPYYSEAAPDRATVSDDTTAGIPLTVTGTVLDASCAPVPGVLLDFWQADGNGVYDNAGFALRGKQTTDAQGRYTLTTVIPGLYPGRTEHIHVKLTAPGGPTVTTQLFFPGTTQNDDDGIFVPSMLVTVLDESPSAMSASFDFVLP